MTLGSELRSTITGPYVPVVLRDKLFLTVLILPITTRPHILLITARALHTQCPAYVMIMPKSFLSGELQGYP